MLEMVLEVLMEAVIEAAALLLGTCVVNVLQLFRDVLRFFGA
jgi:hypothetical protein